MRNKIAEIELVMETIKNVPDIMCITEHWMTKDEIQFLNIQGFIVMSNFSREKYIHGGTCILVKEDIKDFEEVPYINEMSIEKEIEGSCIVSRNRKLVIMSIYRTCLGNVQIFFEQLDEILKRIDKEFTKYHIVICGDFNINLLGESQASYDLTDMMGSYNFEQTIKEPSRITKISKTLIDNIFVRNCNYWNNKNLNLLLSDHRAQIISVECNNFQNKKYLVERRLFTECKIQQLFNNLQDTTWQNVLDEMDPDRAYNRFSEILDLHVRIIFPKKRLCTANTTKAWITKGIRISSARKRIIWEELQKCKISCVYYKKYCSILKTVVEQAKIMSNRLYINTAENKIKATWNLVNNITKGKKDINGSILENFPNEDETKVLNKINSHYINVCGKNNVSLYSEPSIEPCVKSIFLNPVMEPEVYGYITRLKNKKSVGSDEIPVNILKNCASLIVTPLTHIMNQILTTGKYPQKLKEALVMPVYKKGDKANIQNYRPVALLSNVGKIFERIIFDKMINFFEKNRVIVEHQYGFRKKKSTINAIYQALVTIIKSLNQNQITAALCLDLSKAFDRVVHEILLAKLEKNGIRGIALELMRSYLIGRTQRVIGRGKNGDMRASESSRVEVGVPQGSILGPLLYIMYTNDLVQLTQSEVIMFADDTSLICKATNESDCEKILQDGLENLIEWYKMNNLELNIEKTKLIVFRKRKENIRLKYQGTQIGEVGSLSFLGIHVDQKLNWKEHIGKVATSIARQCYAIRLVSSTVGLSAALTAYHSYVQSKIRKNV
ncbi:hypothetical protein WA026_017703 [Henosepilachna vigintioctopunctata]|uniref:Reverse transcriptase domain-containing protein n=1 Tax=Henosepilachna vigintioctopunctata TaxID=420089 RepID=A0AAW1U9D8_9CUCU